MGLVCSLKSIRGGGWKGLSGAAARTGDLKKVERVLL